MRIIALTTVFAAALAITACSGDSKPKATSTPDDFQINAAYFRALDQSVNVALAGPTDPPDPTPVPETTALTEPTVLPIDQDIAALRAFAAALESLQPPPAASAAHQALLDATRDLVVHQDPALATTTPVNEATATAETASAEQRFHDACIDLATAGQEADAPVHLPCTDTDDSAPPLPAGTAVPAGAPAP
jgi:hypothetical protein